jgi:hypothetical protein
VPKKSIGTWCEGGVERGGDGERALEGCVCDWAMWKITLCPSLLKALWLRKRKHLRIQNLDNWDLARYQSSQGRHPAPFLKVLKTIVSQGRGRVVFFIS